LRKAIRLITVRRGTRFPGRRRVAARGALPYVEAGLGAAADDCIDEPLAVAVGPDDPIPLLLNRKNTMRTRIATAIAPIPTFCASLRTELFNVDLPL
jgi:hypothetical protein